jgi:DNA polymerase-3 subunit delta'
MEQPSSWRVRGHEHAVRMLCAALDHPAHAYLILGPKDTGKRTLALELAKALSCEASASRRPCQTCPACLLVGKMGHPDVSILQPEEKAQISIDQVRAMRQELTLRPNQGRWRVAIIQADMLTEPAADALLKVLEEPCERVVLVLLGASLESIPETVASRCRTVQLGLVPVSVVAEELRARGVQPEEAEKLAALSFGATGWAVRASQDPAMAAARSAIRDDVARWGDESLLSRLQAAQALATGTKMTERRATVMEELEVMMVWWRDVLLAVSGEPDLVVNSTSLGDIERVAARGSTASALAAIRAIAAAGTRITENVDPRLTLEALAVAV